ncbi:hypothetical protein I3760_02G049800 [Carya illinoinensis]|nr:hypothetical protein I3760_02G049800 [Carya illinoinensis]
MEYSCTWWLLYRVLLHLVAPTKVITNEKVMRNNLLNFKDLDNLKLAEGLAKTCFEMHL